ncbi:MAG: PAS domain-containing protein [Leptospiraceae bacterium]|nr:PAS domain-containing protein [Leptospiraceae bacterium]
MRGSIVNTPPGPPEDRFKNLIQLFPVPLAYVNQDEQFEFVNDRFTRLFGYTIHDLPDLDTWWSRAYPDELYRNAIRYNWANLIRQASRTGADIQTHSYTITCKNGDQKIIQISGITIGNDFLATFEDVTKRLRAEQALRESEERFSFSLKAGKLGAWDYYIRDNRLICDNGFYLMLGYKPGSQRINMQILFEMIHAEDRERARAAFQKFVARHSEVYDIEYRIRNAAGEYQWVQSRGDIMEHDGTGNALRITGVHIDINASKTAAEKLAAALGEKEILLKEIHHRVKNNMQTISSLLYKQRQYSEDPQLKEVLDDSINRVKAMALIHEQMYRSASLARINFVDYIKEFSQRLYQAYRQSAMRVELVVESDDVHMPIDKSIPCALILNELITNSLKYAFPDNRPGKICVYGKVEDDFITLTVEDDGIGFEPDFDLTQTRSLGLYLVYNIAVRQLQASLEINLANPTRFEITFKI